MFNNSLTQSDLLPIKDFFDELYFSYVDEVFITGTGDSFFPPFLHTHRKVNLLSTPYLFYYSVFRIGHNSDESYIKRFIPKNVLEIMIELGLLVNHKGEWKTPGISVIPFNGIYSLVPIPKFYPSSEMDHVFPDHSIKDTFSVINKYKSNNMIDVSSNDFGLVGQLYTKLNGGRSVIKAHLQSDFYSNLVNTAVKINQLEDSVTVLMDGDEETDEKFDLVYGNINLTNESILPRHDFGSSISDVKKIIESIEVTKEANLVFVFNIVGEKNEIAGLREATADIREKRGLYSKILVKDKIPLDLYFDKCFKDSLTSWGELAGYKDSHYQKTKADWLKNLNVTDSNFKYIYKVIWHLNYSVPNFEFLPLYQLQNTDPLYAISMMSTNP